MNTFQTISAASLSENPFTLIGKDWMLVAAQKDSKVNALTASWGGLGVLWGKNAAYITIRKSRYTKEFIDAAGSFSLNFFNEDFRENLSYFGKVSGRDEDKISKKGLLTNQYNHVPYFDDARLVLICRSMYAGDLSSANFIDADMDEKWYGDNDYHVLYIAEITDILSR